MGARHSPSGVRNVTIPHHCLDRRAPATDLPVLLPVATDLARRTAIERTAGAPMLRLHATHGIALFALVVIGCVVAHAQPQSQPPQPSIVETLVKWTPLLLRGFVFNLAISALAMAGGTL